MATGGKSQSESSSDDEHPMTDEHTRNIQSQRVSLVKTMRPHGVLDYLLENNVLCDRDADRILGKGPADSEINEALISAIVKTSEKGYRIFIKALRETCQKPLANLVEEKKAETVASNKVEDGILEAARDGNLEQLKKCFNPKVHLSLKGAWQSTPLHIAAENGHVKVVQQLMAWNCDVNTKNVLEYTPLHYAVTGDKSSHADVVAVIAANKQTNVNEVNKNHCTPLLLASENDHKDMVQILLIYNADPNIPDKSENTPLHVAVTNGNPVIAEKLLMAQCQKNAQNQEGNTPLHIAVKEADDDTLGMLLGHHCNPNLLNKAGERPVDIAKKKTGADAAAMVKRIEEEMIAQGLKQEMTREDFLLIRNDDGIIGNDNWKMVFRCLDVDEGYIVEQERKKSSIAEKAYQLFLTWKNKFSKDATLGKFCEVLKGNELNAQADKLRDQFTKSTK